MDPSSSKSSGQITTMALNDGKAGMGGLDTERINKIIHEASKDSPFFKNQQDRQQRIDRQIQAMMNKISGLTSEERKRAAKEMDDKAEVLEPSRRDLSKIIVHVDMDMFYAAVESRDDKHLETIPMAVGSFSMLATSNYHARKFGVRAGMAGFIGKKLCPSLKIVEPDFKKYKAASSEVMSVLEEYDPNYFSASLDEAYLDITDYVKSHMQSSNISVEENSNPLINVLPDKMWDIAFEIVQEMRSKVCEKTKLTCSAGIAHNKTFAKVCSDMKKPNNQFMLKATSVETVQAFVDSVPVKKIGGIGPVQQQKLKALGVETCKDLRDKRDLIKLLLYPSSIGFYLRVSLGVGSNRVLSDYVERKSKGEERTFKATSDLAVLNKWLEDICNDVSRRIKKEGLKGKTVTLKVKWATFKINDKSQSLKYYTDDGAVICDIAQTLLIKLMKEQSKKKEETRVRLIGARISNFEEERPDVDDVTMVEDKRKRSKQESIAKYMKREKAEENLPLFTSSQIMQMQEGFSDVGESYEESFVCCDCRTEFTTLELLEEHVEKINCLESESEKRDEVIEIIDENSSQSIFRCPICNAESNDLASLNSHLDCCLESDTIAN
ncbi:DNA polymerase kappa [Halotydeus destructor]|nr:DNA polymerase kappa [Halotydeus destructor]